MDKAEAKCRLSRVLAVGMGMMFLVLGGLSAQDKTESKSSTESGSGLFQGKSSAVLRRSAVAEAYDFLGTPYLLAGGDSSGIDCSGLTKLVLDNRVSEPLPRQVIQQIETGEPVSGPLLPGDMVFFNTTGVPSHVGIYTGGRRVVHAASSGSRTGVIESGLDEPYYQKRIVEARRIIEHQTPSLNLDSVDSEGDIPQITAPSPGGSWITVCWSNPRPSRELYELEIRNGETVRQLSRHPSAGEDSFEKRIYQPEGEGYTVVLREIIRSKKRQVEVQVPNLRKDFE